MTVCHNTQPKESRLDWYAENIDCIDAAPIFLLFLTQGRAGVRCLLHGT